MANKPLNLANIQGNILGGFNKDFQTFLFVKFKGATQARAWIKTLANSDSDVGVASSDSGSVLRFNAQFKSLGAERVKPETVIAAAWTNLAISFQGLKALKVKATDLGKFPPAFRGGMAARKAAIGDTGASDPGHWIAPFRSKDCDAIVLVAADNEAMLEGRVAAITSSPEFRTGVALLHREEGRTRADEPGHEHFGFKDGVSQPGIRGVTVPDDPIGNPDQGHPGQDLLWPGEFVLGYPTQKPKAKPGVDGPNPDPGPPSKSGPSWTVDGSYLVFRRLAQDVPRFHAQLNALASTHGLSEDLMGAKLVGRYKSGCPLEMRRFQPQPFSPALVDPGIATPALANSDSLNNNFEFGDDPDGAICPLAAHIRKAYPRDEQTTPDPKQSESETQTHRLLRRGIPFGHSVGAPARWRRHGSSRSPVPRLPKGHRVPVRVRPAELGKQPGIPPISEGSRTGTGSDHRPERPRVLRTRASQAADPDPSLRDDDRRRILLLAIDHCAAEAW